MGLGGLRSREIVVTLISILLATPTSAWLLAQLGLNETYRVQHLSAHYARVFLCITVRSHNFPTLIESSWPVRFGPLHAAIFPHRAAHATNTEPRNCRLIQRAVWTQVDSLNRLWVMDIGWNGDNVTMTTPSCGSKLLVYDLLRNNAEVLRIDCSQHISSIPSKLLAMRMGPPPPREHCDHVEKYIYFLRADDSHILAYDMVEQKWQQRLLLSRKYGDDLPEMLPIKPIDIAVTKRRELLIADADGALFSSRNALLLHPNEATRAVSMAHNEIKQSKAVTSTAEDLWGELEMERLGSLLGPSRGMMVNHMDVLYYVVPKFGAVVRCAQYRRNLTAEGNEIIYLTGKNIQQIFFGSEESVWLVTDRILQPTDHCFAGLT